MKTIIIAFVGRMACGKGTACDYFVRRYHAKTIKFSTILRDVLDRLVVPQTRENMSTLSLNLRQSFGQDILAKVIAHDVEHATAALVVVDGVRRPEDVHYLRALAEFHLVGIDVEQRIRYERLHLRRENRDDETKTWEEFVEQDTMLESEVTIPAILQEAEISLDNNGSLEAFDAALDELYQKLVTNAS